MKQRVARRSAFIRGAYLSSNSTGTSFPVTSSRTCWGHRHLPRNKLATTRKLATSPDHLDMSRWSESRRLPRNFLVTSWRLPRNIYYGEVTGKLVPVEFELYRVTCHFLFMGTRIRIDSVMRRRSSSSGRNTSASITVTVTVSSSDLTLTNSSSPSSPSLPSITHQSSSLPYILPAVVLPLQPPD